MRKTTLSDIVSTNLVSRRLSVGLSRSELSRKSKVGRSTIIRIEDRTFLPRMGTLRQLAEALDCEIADLLTAPK